MTRIRKGLSRTLSLILSVAVTLSVICVAVIPASAAVYDAAAAISYAKAHWNDGKGECAEFVRDCLKAGGLTSLTKINCRGLKDQIINGGWGTLQKLSPTNGKFLYSVNRDVVAAGDPIIWYCNTCSSYPHIVLCGGYNSSGYLTYYAHNNAHNNDTLYFDLGSSSHSGHSFTVYSIHMYGSGYYPLDSYIYASYSVTAANGTALRTAPATEVSGKDTAVFTSEYGTLLTIVGSYTNDSGTAYLKTDSGYWVKAADLKKSADLESLSVSGQTLPGDITKGSSFSLKGTIKSASSPISSVTAGIYYNDGTAATEKKVSPDATSYSLSSLDSAISFGSLFTGEYIYKVTAKNSLSEKTLIEQKFSVLAKAYVTVTFDANGGSCSVKSAQAVQGEYLESVPEATLDGYIFDGWYTSDGDKVTLATEFQSNCTVTAHWTKKGSVIDSENLELGTDDYVYAAITVTAENGTIIRYLPYVIYFEEDTACRMAKKGEELIITGVFENSYGETWYMLDDYTWIRAADVRIDANLNSIVISGETYPETLTAGSSFVLKGTVESKVSDITSLTVGVYKKDGTAATKKTVSPNSETYDIKNVDNYIKFGSLAVGTYDYRITAVNYFGEVTVLEHEFAVVSAEAEKVTVTFDPNGGICDTASLEVEQGGSITAMPIPTRSGYEFVGWYGADGKEYTTADLFTADIALTAKWEAAKSDEPSSDELTWTEKTDVYAEYKAANGSAVIRSVPYVYYSGADTAIGTLTDAETVTVIASGENSYGEKWFKTADGGWISGDECEKVTDLMPFALSDNVNYPERIHLSYTAYKLTGTITSLNTDITSVNGGIYNESGTRLYGKTVSLSAPTFDIKTIDNYVAFRSIGAGVYYYRVTVTNGYGTYNVIDYKFTVVDTLPTSVTVTFDPNSGTCGTKTLEVALNGTIGSLPTPTLTGYDFVGWYDEYGNEISADTVIDREMTVTALWKEAETVIGDIDGDGKVSAFDLVRLQQHIFGLTKIDGAETDLNGDGKTDTADLVIIQLKILGIG